MDAGVGRGFEREGFNLAIRRKYVRIEEWAEDDLRAEIDRDYDLWNRIATHGCADPFWPDGVNLNLVRNHIIFKRRVLEERGAVQLNLFGEVVNERPLPPEVPENYMVEDGDFSHRLDKLSTYFPDIVWGKGGEYCV